jgi:DNA (cytosine-5)-methyltransferase 1
MAYDINKKYVEKVERGLLKLGYEVRSEIINAKFYGVPQNRQRLFFIARKVFKGSHAAASESIDRIWSRIRSLASKDLVSFRQGVSGLPRLHPGRGADLMSSCRRGRRSDYSLSLDNNGGVVFNHVARRHNPRDLEAYKIMEEGENALDLHRKRPDLMPYSTTSFSTKFFKIRSNAPSPTIVAHLRRDANSFVHPLDNRGITPREAARLQSFPDSYRFLGSFGIQFEQIGNAVPPLLANVIARAIMDDMNKINYAKHEKEEGTDGTI